MASSCFVPLVVWSVGFSAIGGLPCRSVPCGSVLLFSRSSGFAVQCFLGFGCSLGCSFPFFYEMEIRSALCDSVSWIALVL